MLVAKSVVICHVINAYKKPLATFIGNGKRVSFLITITPNVICVAFCVVLHCVWHKVRMDSKNFYYHSAQGGG